MCNCEPLPFFPHIRPQNPKPQVIASTTCPTHSVCSTLTPEVYCLPPKPPNPNGVYPNRCNASDYTKLKKDLTLVKKVVADHPYLKTNINDITKYTSSYPSYYFKMNIQWGTYVYSTICLDKCKCISL